MVLFLRLVEVLAKEHDLLLEADDQLGDGLGNVRLFDQ